MRNWLSVLSSKAVAMNAIKIALVVGTVLNAINQGDAIVNGLEIEWGKLLLNYFVPYCVSSYSAAKIQIQKKT
ncbi:nitrate/nitrite transporter NrtS [Marinomonas mediterranea]|uniref:nitrate/nitrite transporter NrtS n=1 Tax=Marinomonas mediterranea TaxID=119864 RepID=UPI00234B8F93|nr:nitrate/nitrite transporter NrtS [Marinomonas mediterranea]WCN10967.1 hypothetical protein GV055_19540 [Marinomonas mediterranea]WCN15029.1 hypothetical protein GV054_19445 [Marinomonas mediterranea]